MGKIKAVNASLDRDLEDVYLEVVGHIQQARGRVVKSINHEQIIAYWHIGKSIVEKEQKGQARADYGKQLIKGLSQRLQSDFGKGYSKSNIAYMRQFYLLYSDRIFHEARGKFITSEFDTRLSWTHYRMLMHEARPEVRRFYEIEAAKNHWSTPQLERQMTSCLFERLSASKDTASVMQLANEGQVIQGPEDILKSSVVLDFLGYKEHHTYSEQHLETAIIDHMQDFLLEMGRGFAFIARQKRLTIEGDIFRPDLVFYHAILKCYIVLDLKTARLSHGDVGQMMMYVNYYDREIKQEDDNPTLGLLLCAEQNEAVVKYTLPEDNQQIFSRKYQLHLPTAKELEQEMQREYQAIKARLEQQGDVVEEGV